MFGIPCYVEYLVGLFVPALDLLQSYQRRTRGDREQKATVCTANVQSLPAHTRGPRYRVLYTVCLNL